MQRQPAQDPTITQKVELRIVDNYSGVSHPQMKDLLLSEPALSNAQHEVEHLDVIDQSDCVYGERPLTIDVDDTIGWYDGTAKVRKHTKEF